MTSSPNIFPQDFGSYVLLRKLAKGGMAELFVATVRGRSERVVIKRVLPSYSSESEFLKMFLNEARIAAQLAHPNIVRVFDLGQEGDHLYLAMEFIDGFDLDLVTRVAGGRLPPDIAAGVAAAVCEALHFANRVCDRTGRPLNVVHRDVTPGNVMLTRAGVVKLVDFGVAKAAASIDKTRPGVVKGKFRYMSPEQVAFKELDGRSDLFSLGVLLYEVTTGQRPFERRQVLDTIQALSSWDPPPPDALVPQYPHGLSNVVLRALEKDRDRRYQSGKEMKQALEAAMPRPPGPPEIAAFLADLSRRHPDRLPPPAPADVTPSRIQPLDALSLPTNPSRAAPRSLAVTTPMVPRAASIGNALLSTLDGEPDDDLEVATSQISGAEVQRLLAEAEQRGEPKGRQPTVSGALPSRGRPNGAQSRPGAGELRGAPRARPSSPGLQPAAPVGGDDLDDLDDLGEAATRIASRPSLIRAEPMGQAQEASSTLRDAPNPRAREPENASAEQTLDGPLAPPNAKEPARTAEVGKNDLDTGSRPGRAFRRRRAWPLAAGLAAVLCLAFAAAWALLHASSQAPNPPPDEPLAAVQLDLPQGVASWPSASPSSEARTPSTPADAATPAFWSRTARALSASTSAPPRSWGSSARASTRRTWTRSS